MQGTVIPLGTTSITIGRAADATGVDVRDYDVIYKLLEDIQLAMEGLLAWYREAHRMTPPRQAVESARTHAIDRLTAAGRATPPALAGA